MKKKLAGILSVLMAAAILFCGCASGAGANGGTESSKLSADSEGSLSIYAIASDKKVDAYIKDFNVTYRNIKIEKRSFETQDQMDEEVKTELNAGKGPDIVIFDAATKLDVVKMAENGAFAPLDDKMKVNDNLQAKDYLPGALDAGKVDGKQYILPLSFGIPVVTYNADSDSSLEPSTVISFSDFKKAVDTTRAKYKDDDDRCAAIGSWDFPLIASRAVSLYGGEDQDNRDDIKLVSDFLRDLYGDAEKGQSVTNRFGNTSTAPDHFAFNFTVAPDLAYFVFTESGNYQFVKKENYTISAVKPDNEDGITARVLSYGVLTKNAGNFAYEFLRAAMDSSVRSESTMLGTSLNKAVIKNKIDYYETASSVYNTADGTTIYYSGLTPEIKENLTAVFDEIKDVKIYNQKIMSIYMDSFKPYFNGDKEYDACYKEFENKLEIYLSE